MDFWPEFLANSWGKEFIAGGIGGIAGIVSGYPLDTLRIRQQHSTSGSAISVLRNIMSNGGPAALYRGMGAPLASVTFQNAIVFQTNAVLCRAFDPAVTDNRPPSYKAVALGGFGTGALQSLILTPVELVKIRLQLQDLGTSSHSDLGSSRLGPMQVAKNIFKTEGYKGLYRGLTITMLRDAPSHCFYFWTYEFMREKLHPGCRESGQETLRTMLVAGGLAGVASWVCCYPLDVVKTRLQAQSKMSFQKYSGIVDCFYKSVKEEGYSVLWRGLGTAIARAFVVNGAIFSAYELSLRCLSNNGGFHAENTI
ncbi:Mitochondrial arginine transporter BAC2 [Cucurbita argyrosperma subsp. argyrosperma]